MIKKSKFMFSVWIFYVILINKKIIYFYNHCGYAIPFDGKFENILRSIFISNPLV
jgi:hypothetical protein